MGLAVDGNGLRRFSCAGLLWLLSGGVAYTVGVAFYLARRRRYAHLVWHLFVIAGTACHFSNAFSEQRNEPSTLMGHIPIATSCL